MELDAKSWKILQVVQREARISLTDLASRVALSLPATSERLKRLEEAGVIEAYCASVSPEKAGWVQAASASGGTGTTSWCAHSTTGANAGSRPFQV